MGALERYMPPILVSDNPCLECKESCCVDFKIAKQISNPEEYKRILEEFPFIRVTGQELILHGKREVVVNIHNCDRLNEDGSCEGYFDDPRPDFCVRAGVESRPHDKCVLWQMNHSSDSK